MADTVLFQGDDGTTRTIIDYQTWESIYGTGAIARLLKIAEENNALPVNLDLVNGLLQGTTIDVD